MGTTGRVRGLDAKAAVPALGRGACEADTRAGAGGPHGLGTAAGWCGCRADRACSVGAVAIRLAASLLLICPCPRRPRGMRACVPELRWTRAAWGLRLGRLRGTRRACPACERATARSLFLSWLVCLGSEACDRAGRSCDGRGPLGVCGRRGFDLHGERAPARCGDRPGSCENEGDLWPAGQTTPDQITGATTEARNRKIEKEVSDQFRHGPAPWGWAWVEYSGGQ